MGHARQPQDIVHPLAPPSPEGKNECTKAMGVSKTPLGRGNGNLAGQANGKQKGGHRRERLGPGFGDAQSQSKPLLYRP